MGVHKLLRKRIENLSSICLSAMESLMCHFYSSTAGVPVFSFSPLLARPGGRKPKEELMGRGRFVRLSLRGESLSQELHLHLFGFLLGHIANLSEKRSRILVFGSYLPS